MRKRKLRHQARWVLGCVLLGVVIPLLTYCDTVSDASRAKGAECNASIAETPAIEYFYADPALVSPGGRTDIYWKVSNVSRIEIDGFEKLPDAEWNLEGSCPAWPEETTTFTLKAYLADGTVETQSIVVAVEGDAPVIETFYADQPVVFPGTETMIYWKVSNAARIEIDGFEKIPDWVWPMEGSLPAYPEENTTFTIKAYGSNGRVITRSIEVTVDKDTPVIEKFYAEPEEIMQGAETMIYWKVSNAASIEIDGFEKIPDWVWPMEDSLPAYLEKETIFTLTASGYNGTIIKKSLVVKVTSAGPVIQSFTASETLVTRGQMVTLSWKSDHAVTCTLVLEDGPVLANRPPEGSISIAPTITRTYTLIAIDEEGNEVSKELVITVQ